MLVVFGVIVAVIAAAVGAVLVMFRGAGSDVLIPPGATFRGRSGQDRQS